MLIKSEHQREKKYFSQVGNLQIWEEKKERNKGGERMLKMAQFFLES